MVCMCEFVNTVFTWSSNIFIVVWCTFQIALMLLVPHGQRKWHVGEVPQCMGKVFEVGVLGLIPHRPMSYQIYYVLHNVGGVKCQPFLKHSNHWKRH